MATEVIHEHDTAARGDGSGIVVGIILLIVFMLFLWYAFASGAFQGLIPTGGTNIQVPDRVDVNLNQGQGR
jgi:hypothetical protein